LPRRIRGKSFGRNKRRRNFKPTRTFFGRSYSKPKPVFEEVKGSLRIADLTVGMKSVSVKAKIVEISEPREVFSRFTNRLNRVATAVIEDESGRVNLSLWNEQIDKVKVNDIIQVNNGYVTEFRGIKHLNIGRYGTLEVLK
jgi:replication factor A1